MSGNLSSLPANVTLGEAPPEPMDVDRNQTLPLEIGK